MIVRIIKALAVAAAFAATAPAVQAAEKGKDPFRTLIAEHRQADRLLAKTGTGTATKRKEAFSRLDRDLRLHMAVEEKAVYPLLAQNEKTRRLSDSGTKQHEEIRWLLQEMEKDDAATPKWGEDLRKLKTTVSGHVKEEEKTVFPMARTIFSKAELAKMEEQMTATRAEAK